MTGSKYFVGVFCLAFVLFAQTAYSAQRKLTVNMVTGDVTYKRGKAKAKPVRKATRLKSKDVIRTLVESSLEIKFDDGSILTIEENSIVDLSKLVKNGKVTNTKINVKTGKVLFNIKKLASKRSDFVFETPTATAAIRGTQGGLGTDGSASYFFLEEGALEITPKGGGAPTLIKDLNVALQTLAGLKVEQVPNLNELVAAVTKAQNQVLDTAGTGSNTPADTTGTTPGTDTTGTDTTSQAPGDTTGAAPADTTAGTNEPDTTAAAQQPDTIAVGNDEPGTDDKDLTLVINTPLSGSEIPAGSQLEVSGLTLPGATVTVRDVNVNADAAGNFALSLTAPGNPGNYNMAVTAALDGKSITQDVSFIVPEQAQPLALNVTAPTNGQEFTGGTLVNLAGNVSPGATVTVNGIPATVNGTAWNAEVNVPGLGDQVIKIEAARGDESQAAEVTVNMVPKVIDLTFAISRPAEAAEIKSTIIEVAGTGTAGAKVTVNDVSTAIPASGSWSLMLNAPSTPGTFTISGEAVLGDQSQTAEISVVIPQEELRLTVTAPANNAEIKAALINVTGIATPGAQVSVQGKTALADASGNWSISLASPSEEGDYTLEVIAVLGSQERTSELNILRVIPRVPIVGNVSPIPGEVTEPNILLTGSCNDGAIIEVGDFNTTVRSGRWSIQASWPAEDEGTQVFEVFCVFNGEEEIIGEVSTEYIRARIPLAFQLLTPSKIVQKADQLDVRGSVQGQDITVEVNGKGVPVISGQFSHSISFDESNWEDIEEIEVIVSDGDEEITRLIEIEVDKTSPQINRNKPRFLSEPAIDEGVVKVRVTDNNGDEVTLSFQVDGSEEEDFVFEGSLSQNIPLLAGVHDYKIEAVDLAGNKTIWERRNVAHYPKVNLAIEVLNPRQNRVIPLPPYNPDRSFEPSDDVSIRIKQLPEDDYNYLKEVRIENRANGASRIWKDIEIDDIEFEFDDLPLVPNQTNEIVIRVIPKEGQEKITTRTYVMK